MKIPTCLPCLLLLACSKPPGPVIKPIAPAKVEGAVAETRLSTLTLTAEAEQRLGVLTVPAETRAVARWRTLGGAAAVPAGRSARLVAPFAAQIAAAGPAGAVAAGATVAAGQPLFQLQPLQPEASVLRATAERDLAAAQAAADASITRHRRAEQLLADRTGSVRAVEEAAAALATATADLAAARARLQAWSASRFAPDGSLLLVAPANGTVVSCEVGPGHVVVAGTLLCEVAGQDPLWIRVPVHAGDLAGIDSAAPARVRRLSDPADAPWHEAKVAAAPPAADAATASVDLVYELGNGALRLRPGERVLAMLPLLGSGPRLVVPRAALLVDLHGGSWVYVAKAPRTYTRHRVVVAWTDGHDAILDRGPAPGTAVVTLGAAELFGTEFGTGK